MLFFVLFRFACAFQLFNCVCICLLNRSKSCKKDLWTQINAALQANSKWQRSELGSPQCSASYFRVVDVNSSSPCPYTEDNRNIQAVYHSVSRAFPPAIVAAPGLPINATANDYHHPDSTTTTTVVSSSSSSAAATAASSSSTLSPQPQLQPQCTIPTLRLLCHVNMEPTLSSSSSSSSSSRPHIINEQQHDYEYDDDVIRCVGGGGDGVGVMMSAISTTSVPASTSAHMPAHASILIPSMPPHRLNSL